MACICSYLLVIKDVNTKEERHMLAKHIIVCHGILGRQYRPEVVFMHMLSHSCRQFTAESSSPN